MTEVLNHQNNDNSYTYRLSNLYNYTYTVTYNFFDTPYWNQVYRGYGYLWMEASEIFWHQLIYDPIQDTFLKMTTERLIEYGYPERAVNFHVSGGFHKLMHDFLGGQLAHSAVGFFLELGIHMAIKIVVITTYPLIAPLHLSEYIPSFVLNNIIEPTVKFLGINPLEMINTIRVIPDRLLGEDNFISNTIDSVTLHKNHYHDRIEDQDYEQYMKNFNLWLEGNDALVHAYDDISVFAKNIHLPGMYKKIIYWLEFKIKLFRNTMDVDLSKEHKISHLRDLNITFHHEDHFHKNKTCSNESDYSIKSFAKSSVTFIGEQLPYLVIPIMFYVGGNLYFPVDNLVLDNTQATRLLDIAEYNQQTILTVVKPIIITEGLFQGYKLISRSLSEGHLGLEHSERAIDTKSYTNSCPDFRKLVEIHLMEQSKVPNSSDSRRIDSVANIQDFGSPATPPRVLPQSESQEISTIYDQGVLLCGSDLSSIASFIMPRRNQCSTPNCRLNKVKSAVSFQEEDIPPKYDSPFESRISSSQSSRFTFPLSYNDESNSELDDVGQMQEKILDESEALTTTESAAYISPQDYVVGKDSFGVKDNNY